MDALHDMGGMEGFGTVPDSDVVFAAPWEATAFALVSATRIAGTVDEFRHAIERMDPEQYLTSGYYGRWLAATEIRLRDRGLVTSEEVDARCGSSAARPRAVPSSGVPTERGAHGAVRTVDHPRLFGVGDLVRARRIHPVGHTRLPRYVRGCVGHVVALHPPCVFPDTNAHGLGENPQHLYSVRFTAQELWGAGDHLIHLDLFEPYLEKA